MNAPVAIDVPPAAPHSVDSLRRLALVLVSVNVALGLVGLGVIATGTALPSAVRPALIAANAVVALALLVTVAGLLRALHDAVRRAEALAGDAQAATQRLEDAIEALPAGFELYDADDRLVLTNRQLRAMHPALAELMQRRPRFEDLVRANHAAGQLRIDTPLDDWLAARLAQRRAPGEPVTHRLPDGRWIRNHETRTPHGALVGVRIDVTELMQQRERAEAAWTRLQEAIEALPDGFALYGADDRLVVFNRRYREIYAETAPAIREGATFESLLRYGLARGQYVDAIGREERWIAERLHRHRHPGPPEIQQLPGNRWLRIDERVTADGGIAGVRTDVTELVRREQELKRVNAQLDAANALLTTLSDTDALTGLANRRQFDRRLDEEWARALRHATPLSLLLVDVDHFKRYNDRHGHVAGDECLRHVAALLGGSARRAGDLVARYGGEEFALLLPHTDAGEAMANAQRCLAALDAAAIAHGDSPTAPHVTVSLGVATLATGAEYDSPRAFVLAADAALYRAKQRGRRQAVPAETHVLAVDDRAAGLSRQAGGAT